MLLFIVSDKSLNEVIEIVVEPAHLVLHVLLKLHPPDLNPVYDPSEDSRPIWLLVTIKGV